MYPLRRKLLFVFVCLPYCRGDRCTRISVRVSDQQDYIACAKQRVHQHAPAVDTAVQSSSVLVIRNDNISSFIILTDINELRLSGLNEEASTVTAIP